MGINEKAWHVGFKWTIGNEDVPAGAIAVDNTSKQLHICDIEDAGTDWARAVASHPELYIHSATTPETDYIKMYHDGSYAYLDVDGTTLLTMTTTSLAIAVATTVTGDLTLATQDVSVIQGKYVFFAGQTSGESITSDTANYLEINATTGITLTIGDTDEVAVDASNVTLATNDLVLSAGDIKIAATQYLYLDGGTNDYIRASTDNNVIVNGATTSILGVGGTAVITCAAATATFAQKIVQDDTTASSSTTTGSIQTDGGVGIAGALHVGDDIVAATSTGADVNVNGIFENLTVTGNCTGSVCGVRARAQTDGTARTISNFYGANFDARLVHANDALSGIMAGLQVAVSLGECTTGSLWVYGINIDLSEAGGARATDIKAFIDFQDYDSDGTYRCAALFDVGGSGSRCSTGTSGDLEYNETLRILVNTSARYIPLSTAEGTYTTAYPIVNSATLGYRSTAVFAPDNGYTNYAFSVGNKAAELDITFANAVDQNMNPIQAVINCKAVSTGPTDPSQINVYRAHLTHDTNEMLNLRLKCADFYTEVGVSCTDVYCYQGEIGFTASSITISNEVCVAGFVLNAGSSAVTNSQWRVVNCTLRGSGTPTNSVGIMINAESGTHALGGIEIRGTGMHSAIRIGTPEYDESPMRFADFPAAGTDPVVASAKSGDGSGSIKIRIGGADRWMQYWDAAA